MYTNSLNTSNSSVLHPSCYRNLLQDENPSGVIQQQFLPSYQYTIFFFIQHKDFIFSMTFCNANCSITALQRTQTCDIALFQCRSINSNLSCAGRITHPLRKRIYCLCKLCTNFPCCNCIGSLQCIQMIVPWIWIMIKLPARKAAHYGNHHFPLMADKYILVWYCEPLFLPAHVRSVQKTENDPSR